MTRDDFEYWLADMDDALDRFLASIPASVASHLDYSKPSLDVLEGWLLEKYTSHTSILRASESAFLDGASRYVGETFRHVLGGRWDIRLDDPKYVYYAMPQLTDFAPKTTPVCPSALTTAALNRRTGAYLSQTLTKMQQRYAGAKVGV